MKKPLTFGVIMMIAWLQLQGQRLSIIPMPQTVIYSTGYFNWTTSDYFTLVTSQVDAKQRMAQNALNILQQTFDSLYINYRDSSSDAQHYRVSLRRQTSPYAENAQSGFRLQAEGYWLKILPDEILGKADDEAGFLYLILTIRQLFFGTGKTYRQIPCVTIIDHPSFSFRGVMDDISRGPLPHLSFMKAQIRRLASYKINVFSFYIEHVLKTKRHHSFAPEDGLTISDLVELQEYAMLYNIQLMGSFQSLGHFRNILQDPAYASLGVSDRMLYPGDSNALSFLQEMYEDMMPAFHHPIFNINCDEAYDLSRGPLRPIAAREGEHALFAQHIIPLLHFVDRAGKRPGMWGDMLLKFPEVIPDLPEETVIFTWNYDAKAQFEAWIAPFKTHQLDVVACTGVLNSNRLWPDLHQARANIKGFTTSAWELDAMGTLCTVWDDGGRHFFNTDWYGTCYAAALAWNADSTRHSNFDLDYDIIHHQDSTAAFTSILTDFNQMKQVGRLDRLNTYLLEQHFGSSGLEEEYIDTSGFVKISLDLRKILSSLEKFDSALGSKGKLINEQEIEFWKFKARELLLNIETAGHLLEIESLPEDSICNLTHQLLLKWDDAQTHFQQLWKSENRNYWLDEALKTYQDKLATLREIARPYCTEKESLTSLQNESRVYSFTAGSNPTLTYWLGAGPFQAERGMDIDYFIRNGGEHTMRPVAIDYFRNQNNQDQGWNKIISNRPGILHFADFYGDTKVNGALLAYASASIDSEEAREIEASFIAGTPTLLFLNGEVVFDTRIFEENVVNLSLQKGRNHLLVKSHCDAPCDWYFSLRILNERITQNKYKYYLR